MSNAAPAPVVTSPASASPPSSSASLPPLSVLLSAPSLDPYISQLDEVTLAQLYNQPPPLGSSAASNSATAVYSSPAAVETLQRVDASLAACIDSAWKLSLHLDNGPESAAPPAAAAGSPQSLQPAVSSLLSSLATLDAAARQCELPAPQWLLEQLDDGRNPERGLSELLEQLIASNDRARGRAIGTHSLRAAVEAYVDTAAAREREARQRPEQIKRETASASD